MAKKAEVGETDSYVIASVAGSSLNSLSQSGLLKAFDYLPLTLLQQQQE